MLPRTLTLLRHGRSEVNELTEHAEKKTITTAHAEILKTTPNHRYKLTKLGVKQALSSADWFVANHEPTKLVAYTSNFVRSVETAGHFGMKLEKAGFVFEWSINPLIGERHWGRFQDLDVEQMEKEYEFRKDDPLFWTPQGGISMQVMRLFAREFLDTLHRQHREDEVLVVAHGEYNIALAAEIEKWSDDDYHRHFRLGIPNCGIIQYSRFDNNGQIHGRMARVRRISPARPNWKSGLWKGEWEQIVRKKYTSAELVAIADKAAFFNI